MKLSKLLFIPLIGLFMGGCDMIDYHPYDVRISGPTDINNRNIAKIEAAKIPTPPILGVGSS